MDTRGSAVVASPGGTSQGTNLIFYDVDSVSGTVTVTWDDVGYYERHTNRLNAFQLRLINRGGSNFDIEYRYEDINWVTGDASDGVNGLGGTVARAGWSSGDGFNFIELPQSGFQGPMLALDEGEGLVIFPVRGGVLCSVSPVPSQIEFGAVQVDGSVSAPVTITNNERTPVVIGSIIIVDENGNPMPAGLYQIENDNVSGQSLNTGGSAGFEVRFSPDALAPTSAKARIAVNCNGEELLLDVDLSGRGAMILDIPDESLLECLRAALGRSAGGLSNEDLLGVTSLDLGFKGVKDLSGLEFATNLEILDIRGHDFTDLAAAYQIIDSFELGLLIRDSARPEGTADDVALISSILTTEDNRPLEVLFSTNRLPTLDLDGAMIDTNNLENIAILQRLSLFGVMIDSGNRNRPPVPSGRISLSADRFNLYSFDSSRSADVDGIVDSVQWTWDGGFSTSPQFTRSLPIGLIEVKMKILDNVGASVTQVFTVDNRVPVAKVAANSATEISIATLVGVNYRVDFVESLSDDWDVVQGYEEIAGDGTTMTLSVASEATAGFYRVASSVEAP